MAYEADIRADERERIKRLITLHLCPYMMEQAEALCKLIDASSNDPQLALAEFPEGRNPFTGIPQDPTTPTWPYSKPEPGPDHKRCQSNNDGECIWCFCPQRIDGEPEKSGRSCPIYSWEDE
jgi:hypothetical protein